MTADLASLERGRLWAIRVLGHETAFAIPDPETTDWSEPEPKRGRPTNAEQARRKARAERRGID
jgi:hypothetical protein